MKFLEDDLISGGDHLQNQVPNFDQRGDPPAGSSERPIFVHTPQVLTPGREPVVPQADNVDPFDQVANQDPVEQQIEETVEQHVPQETDEATLGRSNRVRRSAIPDDYEVYFQEVDCNIGAENDP